MYHVDPAHAAREVERSEIPKSRAVGDPDLRKSTRGVPPDVLSDVRDGAHRDAASEEMYRTGSRALERARRPCFASGPFKRFQGTWDLSTPL